MAALKTLVTFTAQVKGDGSSTTAQVDLLNDPIGFSVPGGSSLVFDISSSLPSALSDAFSNDGQTPTMTFGLTHNIINVSWPNPPASGTIVTIGAYLYF